MNKIEVTMDFADSISPEDMQGWGTSIMAAQEPEEKTTTTTRQKKQVGIYELLSYGVGVIKES